MKAFEDAVADLRRLYKPAFRPLFIPRAEEVYRWRVRLECNCTHEVLTVGEDRYPHEFAHTDPITRCRLPDGEFWCWNEHEDVQKVYREIIAWVDKKIHEFPADPEEPFCEGMDAETWATIRHAEPHSSALWRVQLACGHFYEHVHTEVEWKPEDGPRLTSVERAAEMSREFEEMWAEDGATGWPEEGSTRDHFRRMLELRWPRPEPEQDCYACRHAKRITGYQLVGPLVPSVAAAEDAADAKRTRAEARLAAAEAEVRRLRKQLGVADDGAPIRTES